MKRKGTIKYQSHDNLLLLYCDSLISSPFMIKEENVIVAFAGEVDGILAQTLNTGERI